MRLGVFLDEGGDMRSSGTEQPFVALGARSMTVLKHAYAAAVRGGTGSVSTLHVLAQIEPFSSWPGSLYGLVGSGVSVLHIGRGSR